MYNKFPSIISTKYELCRISINNILKQHKKQVRKRREKLYSLIGIQYFKDANSSSSVMFFSTKYNYILDYDKVIQNTRLAWNYLNII